jgi:hypothetical protein
LVTSLVKQQVKQAAPESAPPKFGGKPKPPDLPNSCTSAVKKNGPFGQVLTGHQPETIGKIRILYELQESARHVMFEGLIESAFRSDNLGMGKNDLAEIARDPVASDTHGSAIQSRIHLRFHPCSEFSFRKQLRI